MKKQTQTTYRLRFQLSQQTNIWYAYITNLQIGKIEKPRKPIRAENREIGEQRWTVDGKADEGRRWSGAGWVLNRG
jgi:hypothetical protein